jgi:hypothetical protein
MQESVFALNSGDIIGIGCPHPKSRKIPEETFVYVLCPPKIFQVWIFGVQ